MAYSFQLETFESIEPEWNLLLADSVTNNIFLTPSWQRTWWDTVSPQGQELRLVKVVEGDTTIGIAPLAKQEKVITFLGGTDLWDMHDFIVRRGHERPFYQALMEYLGSEDWREIRLESLVEESPTIRQMTSLASEQGYRVDKGSEGQLMGVSLPDSWEEYLMDLRKKDRHELRRKLRRLQGETDFHIQQLEDVESVSEAMDDFLHLMAQSREEKAQFLTDERGDFFRDMALEMARQGHLRLFFLEVGGVRTAATVCFDYNNTRSLYNSGHNTEYASLGTGFLLKALCLKSAICEGKDYYDLLRGSEPYKHHLGAKERELYCLSIFR
ncbi:MAG: GNAT family N-acetyltransferase [Chloroflexi bacterium]|nr:GNAT family N-acetyltransferase [Chloroflexota bacterium]